MSEQGGTGPSKDRIVEVFLHTTPAIRERQLLELEEEIANLTDEEWERIKRFREAQREDIGPDPS